MMFRIYRYDSPANTLVAECSANDERTPYAFAAALQGADRAEYALGTCFPLNDWHYAEVSA